MHSSKLLIAVVVVAPTLGLGVQGASAQITLLSSNMTTGASDGAGGSVSKSSTPSSLPFCAVDSVVDGGASATTTYGFSASGDTAAFQFLFDRVRVGGDGSGAATTGLEFLFTVTNDVQYSFDGVYTLTGGARLIRQRVELWNWTLGTPVFVSVQESRDTPNESFTLGLQEGDFDNRLVGSTSGTLRAGDTYRMVYEFLIFRLPYSRGSDDSASGNFNFNITPADPVVLTQALVDDGLDLNLQNGIANGLDAKLDAVVRALDDLNENNDVAACNALEGFINAVEAQSGNHIPVDDAIALIEETQQIIALLGCSP